MVGKIKKLQTEGKLIYFYIGFSPFETLPKIKDNDNAIPVSVDCCVQPYYTAQGVVTDLDPNRLFLLLDCNHLEGLELVKGLSDCVVIAQSTTKFFDGDFAKNFSILLHTAQSRMIFPNPTRISESFDTISEEGLCISKHYVFKSSFMNFTMNIEQELKKEYPDIDGKTLFKKIDSEKWRQVVEATKNHLKTLYPTVEAVKGSNTSITSLYSNSGDEGTYFIVSDRLS